MAAAQLTDLPPRIEHGPADFKFEIPNLRFSGPCFVRGPRPLEKGERGRLARSGWRPADRSASCPVLVPAPPSAELRKTGAVLLRRTGVPCMDKRTRLVSRK